jgi:hypothetical protein
MNSRKYGFAIRSEVRKHGEAGEGTCYGDSDGPCFLPDQRMIVGAISFGVSPLCTGVSGAQRVDLIAVLSWVRSSSSVCGGEYIYYLAFTGKVLRVLRHSKGWYAEVVEYGVRLGIPRTNSTSLRPREVAKIARA